MTQQPQPFQALLASEQDILQAMALVREPSRHSVGVRTFGRAQTNAVLLNVEASKELAAPAVRTFAAEVPIPAQGGDETLTNDERIQIAALAKAGIPRGRIADQVWGHRRKYDALKAFLDANG